VSTFIKLLKDSVSDLAHLVFPQVCVGCEDALQQNENILCIQCLGSLPKTNFHLDVENPVARCFWGKIQMQKATSYLYFNKGSAVQQIMHNLKYNNQPETGKLIGRLIGYDLIESDFFKDIDIIVPVPLSAEKLKKRGYNQSEVIAAGLSEAAGIPSELATLVRVKDTGTQTKKSRYLRWENVNTVFEIVNKSAFAGKHILLVDDVITTGSTIEAAASKALEAPGCKVSLITAAFAML
jgi:ComF family protein